MSVLKQQTKQRVDQARRRLIRKIEECGITVHWKEPIYKSDGMNGYTKVGEETRKVKGILTNESGQGNMTMTDSGRKESGTHTLVILYCKDIKPEYLTYFYTDDNQQYRVVETKDINNLHLAYTISLIHTKKEMSGYNG